MVPGRMRHPVPPPGAIEYSPLTRVVSAVMGTVAPSTTWARAKSSYLRSPVGGVATATAMERTVVNTTTVATIEVLRMVVPPDYQNDPQSTLSYASVTILSPLPLYRRP